MLRINEMFGPTIQGEGPQMGQQALFLRLADCPLSCIGCDTPYTWAFTNTRAKRHVTQTVYDRSTEVTSMDAVQIVAHLRTLDPENKTNLLVITGGEPLLQIDQIADELLPVLSQRPVMERKRIEFETAGIIPPARLLESAVTHISTLSMRFNVSPKLASSGNSYEARRNPAALRQFAMLAVRGKAIFKFVLGWTGADGEIAADFEELRELVQAYHIPARTVWLMPQGTTVEAVVQGMRVLTPFALANGFNISSRLQTLVWGAQRGV